MWIGIIALGYAICVFLLIRFLKTVHQWDDEIEMMENRIRYPHRRRVVHYRSAR